MTLDLNNNDKLSLLQTQDGSHTLQSENYHATYHSIFGAVEESIHVFIMAGLDYHRNKTQGLEQLRILEIGMGTGLNLWLAALWADQHQIKIHLDTLEKHPLDKSLTSQLNFNQCLPHLEKDQLSLFDTIHHSDWEQSQQISINVTLCKYQCDVLRHNYPLESYDAIFFDAFAPNSQPELWTKELHTLLYKSLKPNGVLTTYCAKGVVKRMLKDIGYELDQLPGPHRKHEMTRAVKFCE